MAIDNRDGGDGVIGGGGDSGGGTTSPDTPQGPRLPKGSGDPPRHLGTKTGGGPLTHPIVPITTTPLPTSTPQAPPTSEAPKILPRTNQGTPPSRSDTVLPLTQPLPVIYGNAVQCGGQIVYDHVRGDNTRLVCYLVSWGPINSISNITIDAKATSSNLFTATVYTGTAGQAVDSTLSGDGLGWTSSLPGIAYVTVLFNAPTTQNPPLDVTRFLCDVQGMLVRDPRSDSTLVNRYYRDNPALCLADYLTSPRFGGSIADAQTDFAGSVTTSANDSDVLLADGTTKRFTIGLRMDAARPFEDWKETIRAHAQLNVVYNNGLYQIWMDKSQSASSLVFTDTGTAANIITAGSLKVRGSAQVPTRVKVNFFNVSNKKTDVAQDEDAGIVTGLVELVEVTHDLPGIQTYDQAKRIAKYLRKRAGVDKEATLQALQDTGVQVLPGVVVTITSLQLAWTNQLALVTQCSANGGIWTMTVEPYDGTIYDDTQKIVSAASAVASANQNIPVLDIIKPMASVGARVVVAPTTKLVGDITAGATSILVEDNNLASGDRLYMEGAPGGVAQTEYLAVTSGATGTGPYTYSVTRDLAATGAKAWRSGDPIVDTGTTGNGFIDLYSVRSIKASTEHGPTIVGNVRNSATYNDWTPRWAIGNLAGIYGYAATPDIYGCAFGVPTGAWIKIDPTNGVRIGFNTTTNVQIDASGNASFSGAITATSGTIGGWTIGATTLSATNMTIDAGNSKITANGGVIVVDGGSGNIQCGSLTLKSASATGSLQYIFGSGHIHSDVAIDATGSYKVGGTKVVGAQGAAVADSTDTSNAATQLNALLARLRAATGHGLIA